VGVEKVRDRNVLWIVIVAASSFPLTSLEGSFHSGCYRLAEEPH
jgi:hypothetical protein